MKSWSIAIPVLCALLFAAACSDSSDDGAGPDPTSRSGETTAVTQSGQGATTAAPATTTATTAAPTTVAPTTAAPTTTTSTTTTTLVPVETMEFSGSGDGIIALDEGFGRNAVAEITHTGEGIEIDLRDEDGFGIDTLARALGPYEGSRFLVGAVEGPVHFFEIEADGDWTMVVRDVTAAPAVDVTPGAETTGMGDSVVRFETDAPQIIRFECAECVDRVLLRLWSDQGRDTLVDEIGPYAGEQLVPTGSYVVEIRAADEAGSHGWTLSIGQ